MQKQGGNEFDRGVAMQLYERMDKNNDGRVTVDEFKKVFVEAIEILKNKIENCNKYISDYKRSKEQAILKLEEVKRNERLNQYGIQEGSSLTLFVIEAKELKPLDSGVSSDPFVEVELAGVKKTTPVQKRTLNPVWNKEFDL